MEAYIVSDCGSRYPSEDGKWYQRDEVDAEIAALKAEIERLRECKAFVEDCEETGGFIGSAARALLAKLKQEGE